ncbi:MAG: biosis protein MshP [Massilia sp.]|jgi:MSHA biogenesis protein MshP
MKPRMPFRFPRLLPRARRQAGAGLVTAIFLLVVLAGLAAALVSIFGKQRQSSALDEQGTRAYQAARAGIEWALFQRSLPNTAYCPAPADGAATADVTTSFDLPAGPMAGFSVTITCTSVLGPGSANGAINLDRRRIRATACTRLPGGACPAPTNSPDYVERVIEVQI